MEKSVPYPWNRKEERKNADPNDSCILGKDYPEGVVQLLSKMWYSSGWERKERYQYVSMSFSLSVSLSLFPSTLQSTDNE